MQEWRQLQDFMRPYASAASVVPATAIRNDPAVLLTTLGRYFGDLVSTGATLLNRRLQCCSAGTCALRVALQ